MKQTIFAEQKTFELITGNVISTSDGLKKGSMVQIQHPQTKAYIPISAGTYILKNGGKIRCDKTGMIIDLDAPTKMNIHPSRSFMSVSFPRAFMAFAKETVELSTGEKVSFSNGLEIASVVEIHNTKPGSNVPVLLTSGIYRLKTGEFIYVNKDSKIYRIIKGGKTTMKTAFMGPDNPGIKGPTEVETKLRDGTKVITIGGLRVKGILMTQEIGGPQIPLNKGVYQLMDKRFVLIDEGGVIVKIATDRPKASANYSALKFEMSAKKLSARQKLINRFNAIRK